MTSLLDAPPGLGVQRPRIEHIPDYVSTSGYEAIELAESVGLYLDEWQQYVLVGSLGETDAWKCPKCVYVSTSEPVRCPNHPRSQLLHPWSAFEVGLNVPRQNGKGGLLEARELAGLFLLGDRLIIHSAHQFDTSLEAFARLLAYVEDDPELRKRIKRVSHAHGSEGFELRSGQRIRFRTRTKGGGRGFTGDCVILDEAMDIPVNTLAALYPTMSARSNPQIWYTGSSVDQQTDDNGLVFARVRESGVLKTNPRLAYFEWSAPLTLDTITRADAADPANWAAANPALGIRISSQYVGAEFRGPLGLRKFAVERLGVGDWPRTDDAAEKIIEPAKWLACQDVDSEPQNPICFAFDVTPDRSYAAIATCGTRGDGMEHVEVVEHRRGTGWVAERLVELKRDHKPHGIFVDAGGPAGSLVPDIEKALGAEVFKMSAAEHAQAFGRFCDAGPQGTLRHLGTDELSEALDGATTRPLGEALAWSRKRSDVDISPLVAVTLALWGNTQKPKPSHPRVINLARL